MPPRAEAPGAIPLVLHALLTGLRARHEVTLITGFGEESGELEAVEALSRSGLEVHAVDRRRPHGLARQRRRLRLAGTWARGLYPWRTVWFADPGVQKTLDRLTNSRSFDVLAIEDNSMAAFRLPPHLPAVCTEHEVRSPMNLAVSGASRTGPRHMVRVIDRQRWPRYQRYAWRKFDRVQVFTPRDAAHIDGFAPEIAGRVRVNPFGVVLPSPAEPEREEPGTMLFVGNFTHPPNVDAASWLAHEIMPRVRTLNPSARLRIVGGAAPDRVRALAGEGVEFLGEVPAIGPLLERSAVVLAPVRHGLGMRMKVLHALASGKAIVTTRLGAEGLLLEDEAAKPPLIVADGADTIAATAARLLDDGAERRALGDRARRFVQARHSPGAYADRLEAVYEEAIAERENSETRQR